LVQPRKVHGDNSPDCDRDNWCDRAENKCAPKTPPKDGIFKQTAKGGTTLRHCVAICLQTAWLSPPVALSAYYLKGVVPEWDLKDIYLGMMQFMVIQVIGLLLVLFIPSIALWLPGVLGSAKKRP